MTAKVNSVDSINLKEQFDQSKVMAEGHRLVGNLYGKVCSLSSDDAQAKGFLSDLNGLTGPRQGEMDSMKSSDVDTFEHFETETYDGNAIPAGSTDLAKGESDDIEAAKANVLDTLSPLFQDEDSPEPEPEPEPATDGGSTEQSDDPIQDVMDCSMVSIGETLGENLRECIIENDLTLTPETVELPEEDLLEETFEGGTLETAVKLRDEKGWDDAEIIDFLA